MQLLLQDLDYCRKNALILAKMLMMIYRRHNVLYLCNSLELLKNVEFVSLYPILHPFFSFYVSLMMITRSKIGSFKADGCYWITKPVFG